MVRPVVRRGATSVYAARGGVKIALGAGVAAAIAAAAVGVVAIRGDDGPPEAEVFGRRVCEAIVSDDRAAYWRLHVHQGDLTLDGQGEWVPFPGGTVGDFPAWEERIEASFTALMAHLASYGNPIRCGQVQVGEGPSKDGAFRIEEIRVQVIGDAEHWLLLGPSVVTRRGRAFHGERDGLFARFEDQPEAGGPETPAEEPPAQGAPPVAEAWPTDPAPPRREPVGDPQVAEAPDEPAAVAPAPEAGAEATAPDGDARSDEELLSLIVAGPQWDQKQAIALLVARGRRADAVRVLRHSLRTASGMFGDSQARAGLRELGEKPDFSRVAEERPEVGPEETEQLELSIEHRDSQLTVSWRVFFGDALFSSRQMAPFFEITLSGGTLGSRVTKRFSPTPGENTGSEVMATGIGPGEYSASAFLWSQKPDGTQVSDNNIGVHLDLR